MNSVAEQVMANYNELKQDPGVVNAFRALGSRSSDYETHLKGMLSSFSEYLNFDSQKSALQYVKTINGGLDRDAELAFAVRTDNVIQSYDGILSHGREVDSLFTASGVNPILSSHSEKIFYQFPQNPLLKGNLFVNLGATQKQIADVTSAVGRNNWNPLTMYGANGTFTDVLRVADEGVPILQNLAQVTRDSGLPTLEGASGSGGIIAVVVVGTVAACVLGAFLGFWICIAAVGAAA